MLPPTGKKEALNSLISQLSLISVASNWKDLVNDKSAAFYETMRDSSAKDAFRLACPEPRLEQIQDV